MKLQLSKQFFALTMALMLFSLLPATADAQVALIEASQEKPKKCHNGKCPNDHTCVNGICVPDNIFCNCFVRPIPPECAPYCGFLIDPSHTVDVVSIADHNLEANRFEISSLANAQAPKPKKCSNDRDCGGRGWRCFLGTCVYTPPFPWLETIENLFNNEIADPSINQYWLASDVAEK